MKKYLVFIILSLLCYRADCVTTPTVFAAATTVKDPVTPLQFFSTLTMKEVQQLAGRKLSLKEKLSVKLFQWKIKKGFNPLKKEETKDKGKTAMIFGIIGLASLLIPIPFIGFLGSIVFTILALTMGYKARKENPDDSKAKTAIILGWVTVGLFVLAMILAVVILASWSWGWG